VVSAPRLRRLAPALILFASLAACRASPGRADAEPIAPTAAPTPPLERTSDRGDRTLHVTPIGRLAPEVPPE
jgi:hypothetical protein